jgi:hypothetical protein
MGIRNPVANRQQGRSEAMSHVSSSVETTGTLEKGRRIVLDEPLPGSGEGRVRVIVFLDEDADFGETEWLRAASGSSAFAFLADEPELYTLGDGEPFHDQG